MLPTLLHSVRVDGESEQVAEKQEELGDLQRCTGRLSAFLSVQQRKDFTGGVVHRFDCVSIVLNDLPGNSNDLLFIGPAVVVNI